MSLWTRQTDYTILTLNVVYKTVANTSPLGFNHIKYYFELAIVNKAL
jgi:hypothetical protein